MRGNCFKNAGLSGHMQMRLRHHSRYWLNCISQSKFKHEALTTKQGDVREKFLPRGSISGHLCFVKSDVSWFEKFSELTECSGETKKKLFSLSKCVKKIFEDDLLRFYQFEKIYFEMAITIQKNIQHTFDDAK